MYQVKLLNKKEVAKDTMAFWFEKPAGYTFAAGQHTDWKLINPMETDPEGDTRELSFASSPQEENLMVATRMRDTAFKRVLRDLPIGGQIEIKDPEGDFVLHSDKTRPAIFLAGGIGITPFRSIIFSRPETKIFLFYSNRLPEDAAFLEEFKTIDAPNFKFIPIFSEQTGHLTWNTIKENMANTVSPVFYIAGPPQMVHSLREMLIASSIDDLSIRTEDFEGY